MEMWGLKVGNYVIKYMHDFIKSSRILFRLGLRREILHLVAVFLTYIRANALDVSLTCSRRSDSRERCEVKRSTKK